MKTSHTPQLLCARNTTCGVCSRGAYGERSHITSAPRSTSSCIRSSCFPKSWALLYVQQRFLQQWFQAPWAYIHSVTSSAEPLENMRKAPGIHFTSSIKLKNFSIAPVSSLTKQKSRGLDPAGYPSLKPRWLLQRFKALDTPGEAIPFSALLL